MEIDMNNIFYIDPTLPLMPPSLSPQGASKDNIFCGHLFSLNLTKIQDKLMAIVNIVSQALNSVVLLFKKNEPQSVSQLSFRSLKKTVSAPQEIHKKEAATIPQKLTLNEMDLSQILHKYDELQNKGTVPHLGHDKITQLFQQELRNGNALDEEISQLMVDLGVNNNDSYADKKNELTILFLLARNKPEQKDTKLIMHSILSSLVSIIQTTNLQFKEEALASEKALLKQFHLYDEMDEMQLPLYQSSYRFPLGYLIYFQNHLQKTNSFISQNLETEIYDILENPCLEQFKFFCQKLKRPETLSDQQIKEMSLAVIAILNFLSANLPVDEKNISLWGDLHGYYKEILDIKKTTNNQEVKQNIAFAFEHFQTFIEDGIVAFELLSVGGDAESVTQLLYGRSNEELEQIKSKNRERVANNLNEFSTQVKQGKPITIEMLSKLHATNNRGIVPRHISHIRKKKEETVQFGKRVGVIPRDVEPAVQDVLDKANRLLQNPPQGLLSTIMYSIEVAKLHNRLLDIHPFLDRNGSTSLLFMELLMSVHGNYSPKKERIKDYNANLSMILQNPLAVAIVNYEHYKIAHRFGHYKSKHLKMDEETEAFYKNEIEKQKLRHK